MTAEYAKLQRDGLGVTTDAAYLTEEPKNATVNQVVVGPEVARAMGTRFYKRLENGMYEIKPEPAPRC